MPWSSVSVRRVRNLTLCLSLTAALPAVGDIAYVTCQNGNALSVLDLNRATEISRWSLPGKPAGVAVHEEAVFTVSVDSKTVRRLDPGTGDIQAQIILEGGPIGVAHDAGHNRLFVSDWFNARIWVLRDDTLEMLQELPVGAAPAGLAISPDGRFLASADRDANRVSVFDAKTLALIHQTDVGERPFGLRFAPDGRLFVGNVGSDDVSILDPEQGHILASVPVGVRPYGVAFAQGKAFVTNQYEDSVSVIDLVTLEHLAKIDVGEYPEGIDTSHDGARILVANWFENTVTVIDANTMAVLDTIETCDGPRAFGEFVLKHDVSKLPDF